MSRNAAFHEVWGRTAFAGESAPVVELYGVGSLSATVCRGRIHGGLWRIRRVPPSTAIQCKGSRWSKSVD